MRVIPFSTMSDRPPSTYIARLGRLVLAMALSSACLQSGCAGLRTERASAAQVPAGSPIPTLESVPDWALADTSRNDSSEAGIGAGGTLDHATRSALHDVASRLSVSIESQLRDVYREVDGISTESLEQVIETRVLSTLFSGWERTRSVQIDGMFWVEIRIDRDRLVRDSILELSELAASVDMRLESAGGSSIARLLALQATSRERARASHLITLISGLDSTFGREDWNRRRGDWRRIDESARRSLIFEVRSDPASTEVARWLESLLASERLTIGQGNCGNDDAVCIDIRSEIVEANVAHRHIARIRAYFSFLEPGGSVFREVDLMGRGDSTADSDRARRHAMDDLRRNFQTSSVLRGLIEH
jgi:hypothetical protein